MTADVPDNFNIPALGNLEIAVLEHVWQVSDVSAKEAYAAIGAARGISVNTVQSTLERLFRKKLLKRTKAGHAFRYSTQVLKEHLIAGLINEVLGRFDNDPASSVAAFVEAAERLDEEALQVLEVELKKRRGRDNRS